MEMKQNIFAANEPNSLRQQSRIEEGYCEMHLVLLVTEVEILPALVEMSSAKQHNLVIQGLMVTRYFKIVVKIIEEFVCKVVQEGFQVLRI